jgi:hypothetical protein
VYNTPNHNSVGAHYKDLTSNNGGWTKSRNPVILNKKYYYVSFDIFVTITI